MDFCHVKISNLDFSCTDVISYVLCENFLSCMDIT